VIMLLPACKGATWDAVTTPDRSSNRNQAFVRDDRSRILVGSVCHSWSSCFWIDRGATASVILPPANRESAVTTGNGIVMGPPRTGKSLRAMMKP
jgi:hypothetical protein